MGVCSADERATHASSPQPKLDLSLRKSYERCLSKTRRFPGLVEKHIGGLRGKRIYDVGAGTGYFSWRLVRRGAVVVAVDIEDSLLRYMERRRDSLGIAPTQWVIRKVLLTHPDLVRGEADWALLVNVYHHLPNRVEYLRRLHKALPEKGGVILVEWAPRETPVGPPLSQRLFPSEVENDLRKAGFSRIQVDESLLPYQYIFLAQP